MRLPNGLFKLSFVAYFPILASCSCCFAFYQLSRKTLLERFCDVSLVGSNIYLIKQAAESAPNLTTSNGIALFSLRVGRNNSFLISFPGIFLPVLLTFVFLLKSRIYLIYSSSGLNFNGLKIFNMNCLSNIFQPYLSNFNMAPYEKLTALPIYLTY